MDSSDRSVFQEFQDSEKSRAESERTLDGGVRGEEDKNTDLEKKEFGVAPPGEDQPGVLASFASEEWTMLEAADNQPHGVLIDPNEGVSPVVDVSYFVNQALCGLPSALQILTHPAFSCQSSQTDEETTQVVDCISYCAHPTEPTCTHQFQDVHPELNAQRIDRKDSKDLRLDIDYKKDIKFACPKEEIGQGAFGIVFKGVYKKRPVAVKQIGQELTNPRALKSIQDELKVFSQLGHHKNLVKCYGGSMTLPHIFIVEELMESDLHSLLHPNGAGMSLDAQVKPLSLKQTLEIALDIAQGLNHMHPTFVHRDIKPQNILLKCGVAKIADFGLSRIKTQAYISSGSTARHGTVQYMSPESMQGKVDAKSDIYSLGLLLWECLVGQIPFLDLNTISVMYNVSFKGLRPTFSQAIEYPMSLKNLIIDCWNQDPQDRPDCSVVLARLKEIYTLLFEAQ